MRAVRGHAGGSDGSRRNEAGQTLVEFALVLPIFFLMLFGLVDGGRLVFLNSTLSQAAREGARVGSVEAGWIGSSDPGCGTSGGPVCPATVDALRADIRNAANRMIGPFAPFTTANVFVSCDATTPPTGNWTTQSCLSLATGDLISVRVVYTFSAITPVVGQLINSMQLSGSATMAIN